MYIALGSGNGVDRFVTYFPSQGALNVTCNVTNGVPLWRVNDITYTTNQIDDGGLPGHGQTIIAGKSILEISVPVNTTKYVCFVTQDYTDVLSDTIIVNVAGKFKYAHL